MKNAVLGCAAVAGAMFATQAIGYEAVAVSGGGSVAGTVSFKGEAPAPRSVAITKDNQVCGTGNREIVDVNVRDGKLAGVVVYVAKLDKGKPWGEVAAPVLDQKGCEFIPDMLIVQKGTELTIRNSDPVLHNVHTYEIIGNVRRTMFNLGQPDQGEIKQSIRMRRANAIKIECDAHDFMHGWAFAADNPYAVVTAPDGSFSIADVPPGDYELKVWHPTLGEQSTQVSVAGGAAASATFEFSK